MEKYIFIESTKERKNGHVSHLMKYEGNNFYYEVSFATGKALRYGLGLTLEQIEDYGYKILDLTKENPTLVGYNTRFADYIIDKKRGNYNGWYI